MPMDELITKRYLGLTLEPIHVGGDRAAATAVTVRDIDGLPFIPASSLKGAVRALCSTTYGAIGCDGKGWNCPQPHRCLSCSAFGFANYHHGRTASSLVRFSSASLAFLPLQTPTGTLWVTSGPRLRHSLVPTTAPADTFLGRTESVRPTDLEYILGLLRGSESPQEPITATTITTERWNGPIELQEIYRRTIVLDEGCFGSLARRSTGLSTSIAVDAGTGRAKEGALFAVEHIQRMSVLTFEIILFNPVLRGIRDFLTSKSGEESTVPATLAQVADVIRTGLDKLRYYGLGGKRSRGYGRLLVWEVPVLRSAVSEGSLLRTKTTGGPLVFISHSSKNKTVARRLAADLQAEQFDVWLDERKILVGDSLHREIEAGIRDCDYLILLISPESLQSEWVQEELNAIRAREKSSREVVLLPATLDEFDTRLLPPLLRDRKYASLSKYEDGIRDLIESIRGHEERKGRPTA